MNKDIQNIFENYSNTWNMTPKESFKKDKRFFSYVIENNKELHPLKSLPTKVIFELYKLKLRSFYDTQHPGVITENTNLTDQEAFDILQESTKTVTNKEAYLGVKDVFTHLTLDYLYERYLHLRVKPVIKERYRGRVIREMRTRDFVSQLKTQVDQFVQANPKMAGDPRFAQLQKVVTGMDREGRAKPAGAEETVTSTTDVTTAPPAPAPAAAPAPEVDVTTDVATTPGTAAAVPPVIDNTIDVEEVPAKPGLMSRMGGALKRGAGAVGRGIKKGAEAIAPTAGAIGGTLAGGALGGIPGAIAGGAVGKALGRGAQAGLRQKGGLGARLKAAGQAPVGKDLATGAMIGGIGALGGAGGGEEVVDTEVDVAPDVDQSGTIPEPEPVTSVDVETDVGPEPEINPNTGEELPPRRETQSAINPARGSQKGGGKLAELAARRGR